MPEPSRLPDLATLQRLLLGELPAHEAEPILHQLDDLVVRARVAEQLRTQETLLAEAARRAADQPGRLASLIQQLVKLARVNSPASEFATVLTDQTPGAAVNPFPFLAPPQLKDEIGRLGGYRVLKLLGRGGMGMVFLAEDMSLRRKLALKVMKPEVAANPVSRAYFLREAQAAAAVQHDHIVTIYQVSEHDDVLFIALEYLRGTPLDKFLGQRAQPPITQVLRIGREIAEGLAAAHSRGLIHRDVKPANVWLKSPKGHVKLLDFGLARPGETDERLTQTGVVVGTPAYMSPEQARSQPVTTASDLFSLGVILYQMTTGEQPFTGKNVYDILEMVVRHEPPPPIARNPAIPPELSNLVMRLLAKHPGHRPGSARQVAGELDAIEKELRQQKIPVAQAVASQELILIEADPFAGIDEPTEALTEVPRKPPPERSRRLLMLGIIAALIIITGVVIGVLPGKKPPESGKEVVENKKITPILPPPKLKDADREAAEWILKQPKGQVSVIVGKQVRQITAREELPKEPFTLRAFRIYGLTDADVGRLVPLKDLDNLDLRNVRLTDAGWKRLSEAEFPRLKDLYLWGDGTLDNALPHLHRFRGLTALLLNDTKISDAALRHLTGAEITNAGLVQMGELPRLVHLGLAKTKVTDAGLEHLLKFPKLESLDLTGTAVTDAGLAKLQRIPLKTLDLSDTKVSDAGLRHLGSMSRLRTLRLDQTQVKGAGLADLKSLTELEVLGLAFLPITQEMLEPLKELKDLNHYDLKGTKLTDGDIERFKEWKHLVWLDVLHIPQVSQGAAKKLAVALPGCEIIWGDDDRGGIHFNKDGPDRQAALRLLERGGQVAVKVGERKSNVTSPEQLPTTPFELVTITLTGVTDADAELLVPLLHVRYISLSDARLSDAAWARIGRTRFAPALEALTVDGPAAASLQRHLTSFPRLANLALQDPSVTDAGLEKLHQLPDLHTLHFDGAGITDAALEQVPKLVKLNSLVLRNTRITDAGLAKLRTSPVRYLDLIGTGVTDDGLKHLTGLPQLLELRLLRTRVTNDGLAHLKDVPNLVMLNLHGRPITRKGLENLRECGNLQALYLHGVPVKDEDIEPLTECKRLTFLNVLCTNVGPKGFARLRTALPGCDIRWQPDPERTGAAVAQALGGEVGLRLDDDPERIEQYPPARPLPRGTFRVVSIARTSGTVGDNDFVVLQQLRHLESLELPRTKLDNGEVEELCDTLFAPKLRRLHLGAPITDRALVHFQRFRALTEFSLPCPNITDAGLEHLKALSTLRKLDLRGTKATVAGVKQLAAALPECRIESEHGVIEPAKK